MASENSLAVMISSTVASKRTLSELRDAGMAGSIFTLHHLVEYSASTPPRPPSSEQPALLYLEYHGPKENNGNRSTGHEQSV